MIQLWHCKDARSLRPLWTLEEMGLPYDLHTLPFPPRVFDKAYLGINPLGTVPYFVDGEVQMTESTGICLYLVQHYADAAGPLAVQPHEADHGRYLNWLFHSDATLTFPQTIVLRYTALEPPERRLPQAAEDYRKWTLARLRLLDAHLLTHDWACAGRFTIADIAVGYALFLGETLGLAVDYAPQTRDYLARLKARPAFAAARQR